jgi:BirA family biotin operon repressor/biotin-[acetyl-CoA-carboxylase] ligase
MSEPDFSANVTVPYRSRVSAGVLAKADRLRSDRIKAALRPATIGREIVVLEQTGSTNDAIYERANKDAAEGLVLFAENQTAGRGQRGNTWVSAPGKGLWLSILLRPAIAVEDSSLLTTWAAKTVASTISTSCNLFASVKPPNDVYIGERKVAGVLVEMKAQSRVPHLAIVGIGLNVNQTVADFPTGLQDRATSLAIATGRAHDRNELAIALLRNLDRTYRQIVAGPARRNLSIRPRGA